MIIQVSVALWLSMCNVEYIMINPILRPGYTALAGARSLALDSEGWLLLTEDVLRLPLSMLAAVRRTVRKGAWRYANDPLNSVRETSERDYRREIMRNEEAAAAPRGTRP
jgi:hypothetical protein